MPIEINYFAREEKYTQEDESKLYYNPRYLIEKRLKSGHCVASISYQEGWHGYAVYDLLAEDRDMPISAISRIFSIRDTHIWDTVSISSNVANEIHKRLEKITPPPEPNPNGTVDKWPSDNRREYNVILDHTYDNIHFWYDTDYHRLLRRSSGIPLDETWMEHIDQIVDLCEEFTGNKLRYPDRTKETSEAFRLLFRKKSKHAKYQGKWIKPKLPDYVSNNHILDKFEDKDLRDNLALQLDFKVYLPTLMRYPDLIEFTFQKLAEAEPTNWDADEQDVLQDYFTAFWDYVLYYYPSLWTDSYTFIYGVHLTGLDMSLHIKYWKSSIDDVSASRHLAEYVRSLYEHYTNEGVGVFDTVPKILRCWLRDVGEGDYFLKRYMEYDGVRPFAHEYAEASETLSLLHEAGL